MGITGLVVDNFWNRVVNGQWFEHAEWSHALAVLLVLIGCFLFTTNVWKFRLRCKWTRLFRLFGLYHWKFYGEMGLRTFEEIVLFSLWNLSVWKPLFPNLQPSFLSFSGQQANHVNIGLSTAMAASSDRLSCGSSNLYVKELLLCAFHYAKNSGNFGWKPNGTVRSKWFVPTKHFCRRAGQSDRMDITRVYLSIFRWGAETMNSLIMSAASIPHITTVSCRI